MKKSKKACLALAAAVFTAGSALSVSAAVCGCPYGSGELGGPDGGGRCTCLENQGPNGSGVCVCSENMYGSYYNNYNYNYNYGGQPENNPAYDNGWTGGGPGDMGTNPEGNDGSWEDDQYSGGPGSSDAQNQLKIEENTYYIFGDPCTSGTWEQQADGSWKLKKEDGNYVSSQWAKLGGATYLIDPYGTMLTGFQRVNGSWYYFNSVGAMQTGWLLKDGKYYFLNSDGTMVFGWFNTQGNWYYMDKSTGAMLTNTYTPDGRYVNVEGVLVS